MKRFVATYAPLIVREHLLRFMYRASWKNYYGMKSFPPRLVEIWETIANSTTKPAKSFFYAMQDRDLWLIASSAEMLGANFNDPELVQLTPDEKQQLQRAIQVGVSLFQKKRTLYAGTRDFHKQLVGSISYFNGDYDDYPDYTYSGYTGEAYPTPKDKKVQSGASWDVSHFYRVPIFLRSLYDNKQAASIEFPSDHDIELITNQLMYVVFRGNYQEPLFNNFFDGSNGWYRVGYQNQRFGYAPVQYCTCSSPERACLVDGAVQGWGQLTAFNRNLMELEHSLATLAGRGDAEAKQFRNRYYCQGHENYEFKDDAGKPRYPLLLFLVLAEQPRQLRGCTQ